jgi:serine/threonine protein kinase
MTPTPQCGYLSTLQRSYKVGRLTSGRIYSKPETIARALERHWRSGIRDLRLRHGPWRYSRRLGRNDATQGWKIHVSATLLSANDVFSRARPILTEYDAAFKVPARLDFLAALNSGLRSFSQVGKFLTVYPKNEVEAVKLARELHTATRRLHGPKIPFDAHYRKNSLVFYRYAPFLGVDRNDNPKIVDTAGRLRRDVRDRAHAVPNWIRNPLNKRRAQSNQPRLPVWIEKGLLPFKALARRGKGGVYQAVDLSVSPPRLVIIKEGRRHGETDWVGQDGFARIKHEGRILRRLHRRGLPVPKPLREFNHDGNRYLVLEIAPGRPSFTKNRKKSGRFSWRCAMKLLNRLGPILRAIHSAGFVWRDCKPDHIFISHDKIYLIDFEGACRISETGALPWGSLHYLPPIYRKQFAARQPGTLEDDYALGVILFQFLSGKFPAASARMREAVYKRTRCPNCLRATIESLLKF